MGHASTILKELLRDHPEAGRDEAEEPLVNRANISTHELTNPPLTCLWASDDVPLAVIGGQPKSRKLSVAIYGPIPADIVYSQPL